MFRPSDSHRRQILERRVERSRRALPAGEVEVEVVHERLVAGDRLERVVVRERQHRPARGSPASGLA